METPTSTLASAGPVEEERLHERRRRLAKGAEELHPGAGWKIYQMWRERNERLFGCQMQPCGIQFGLTCRDSTAGRSPSPEGSADPGDPSSYGCWLPREQIIVLHRRLLQREGRVWWPSHERLGPRFVEDVLLRQMIRQYIGSVRRGEDRREFASGRRLPAGALQRDPLWVGEVNRLTKALGIGEEKAAILPEEAGAQEIPGGILTARETALWPYLSRPDGYYNEDPDAVLAEELPHLE